MQKKHGIFTVAPVANPIIGTVTLGHSGWTPPVKTLFGLGGGKHPDIVSILL